MYRQFTDRGFIIQTKMMTALKTLPFGKNDMDTEYLHLLNNMLHYWLKETCDLSDHDIDRLNGEITNIDQTIQEGLAQPETVDLTANLLIQTKILSERRGHWYKWRDHIQKALTFDNLTLHQRTQLLNQIGYLCSFLSHFNDAIIYHQAARDLAQKHNFYVQWARAEANLCNDYRFTHQYDLGESAGRTAIALCKEHNINNWINGFAHGRLGFLFSQWKKPNEAMPLLEKAKEHFSHINDQTAYARELLNIGECLDSVGKFEQSLMFKLEAKNIVSQTDNEIDLAEINNDLGVSYTLLGQNSLATELFEAAIFTYQNLNFPFRIAHTSNNLAECFTRQKKFIEANYYIQLSKPFFESQNDQLNVANSYSILGFIYENENRLEKAKEAYSIGLDALKSLPNSHAKTVIETELNNRASQLQ